MPVVRQEAVERHRNHYLKVARRSSVNWQDADSSVAQMRHAWEQSATDDLALLRAWASALSSFYTLRGYWDDEYSVKRRPLTAARQAHDEHIEAWCLHELGYLAEKQDRFDEALQLYRAALHLRQKLQVAVEIAATMANLGGVYQRQGHLNEALTLFEQALSVFQKISDRQAEASVVNGIAGIYQAQGDREKAI